MIILRITTKVGTKRLYNVKTTWKISYILELCCQLLGISVQESFYLSYDPKGVQQMDETFSVRKCKLENGSNIYLQSGDFNLLNVGGQKKITKDGNIVNQSIEDTYQKEGFRPGLQSLKTIKNHWTLTDFKLLDAKFEFIVKSQKESRCAKVNMNQDMINEFQTFIQRVGFQSYRVGFLYGTIKENQSYVSLIYEPAQCNLELEEDPHITNVERLVSALGLQRLGCIFCHPPRDANTFFEPQELYFLASIIKPHEVIVRVCQIESNIQMDSFQLSEQCFTMVEQGALDDECKVQKPFTAIVEGKLAEQVDVNFFLVNVPIGHFCESKFLYKFPKPHRGETIPTIQDVKTHFKDSYKRGWTRQDLCMDFHLLLFLMTIIGVEETLQLVACLLEKNLHQGHEILLESLINS